MKTTLTFREDTAGSIFWNHVVNFKDVTRITGIGLGRVEVEVVPADVEKLPMRIRQITAFAQDCGLEPVA